MSEEKRVWVIDNGSPLMGIVRCQVYDWYVLEYFAGLATLKKTLALVKVSDCYGTDLAAYEAAWMRSFEEGQASLERGRKYKEKIQSMRGIVLYAERESKVE